MNNEEKILIVLEQLQQGQAQMQRDISGVNSEITGMKSEITGIKSEITEMKSDISEMKSDIAELQRRTDQHHNSLVLIENDHARKLNVIYEAYADDQRNVKQIEPLKRKVDNHDDRIWALEQFAKGTA